MSAARAKLRRRALMIAGGVAAASLLLGVLAWMPAGSDLQRSEVGKRVLPAFADKQKLIQLIMVTTQEESYHLVRNDDGWVLAEKGSYPVTDAKIQELTEALSNIVYAEAMTRDERKFDRIGLGDPATGGTGALLEVGDGQGNSFAKLLVGHRDGRSYVRKPDDLQAWAVDGAVMPPLQRGAAWLDLGVLEIPADQIVGADVRPAQGPSYRLAAAPGGGFALAPPHDRRQVVAALAPTMAAEALTRFAPTDVAQALDVAAGAPVAEHVTRLASGVVIVVRSWRKDERGWVTVSAAVAEGASAEAAILAGEINAKAAPWAFALTELDWGTFSTPLAAIAE
jgi:hypothetical protein